MKITAKIARSFNFEHRAFVEHLDIRKNGQVQLQELFGALADKFQIFFSSKEQIAVRNALFPSATNETIQESAPRVLQLGGVGAPSKALGLSVIQKSMPQADKEKTDGGRNFLHLLTAT